MIINKICGGTATRIAVLIVVLAILLAGNAGAATLIKSERVDNAAGRWNNTFGWEGLKKTSDGVQISDDSIVAVVTKSYGAGEPQFFSDNSYALSDNLSKVIIQFYEEPVLSYAVKLKAGHKQNKIEADSKIKTYKDNIFNIHSNAKKEIEQNNIEIKYTREYYEVFNGFAAEISSKDIVKLKKLSNIKAVYTDQKVYASLTDSVPLINANSVWNMLDANGTNITGKNVKVAIIDTGIDYTHPDLGGGFGAGYKVTAGWDFYNNDPDPMDDHGHGTHVAGIVAANGTLKGVAPDAQLMAYKVLSSGGWGYESHIIAGIEKAVDPDSDPLTDDGADIISMSLGGGGNPDDPMSQAVDNAVDNGVVAVIAAGNWGPGDKTISSPGTARKAITVGATDKQDIIASFSSRGPVVWSGGMIIKPDVVAPGVSITSTVPGGSCSLCSPSKYNTVSGTSMATPHVSGAAALLLQLHPEWSPEQIRSALITTAKDLNYDAYTQGAGRVDAFKAASVEALVTPSLLSLGLVNLSQENWQVNRDIELKNIASTTKNFNITVQMPYTPGVVPGLSITSADLNPDSSAVINFSISVDNSIVPNGNYEGDIVVSSDTETLKIPFAFIKKSYLKLTFSEVPWVVLIHNRADFYEFLVPTSNSSVSLLNDGVYDIMTIFTPDIFVVREGVNVAGSTELYINKSEAVNKMEIIAIDENGNNFYPSSGGLSFIHNSSGTGLIFFGGFNRIKYFSNISNAYNIDWEMKDQSSNVYIINGFIRDGISGDVTFRNKPEDYRKLEVAFHPNILTQEIIPIYWLSHLDTWWAFGVSTYGQGMELNSFNQDLYITPLPGPDFYFNSIQIEPRNGNYWMNEFLYRSPYLFVKNDSVERSLFPLGSSLPSINLSQPNTTNLHVGLNPEHWSGKFENLDNTIRLKAYRGSFIWVFLTQMYDFTEHENLPYKLYKDGALVGSGTLNGAGSWYITSYIEIPLSISGKYSLIVEKNYSINGNRKATLNATFDTSKSDKNPPSLTSMNLISNGELTDGIDPAKDNRINFSVDPIGGSINSVLVYYNESGWTQLPLMNNDLDYSAQIPGGLTCAVCSFKILVIDDSLNSLEYQFESPVQVIDAIPPTSVTNLHNISYAQTYINWTWNDPADADFSHVMVYLNEIFRTIVPKGVQYYFAGGLYPDTSYTVGLRAVDASGNINETWVNHTARTAPGTIVSPPPEIPVSRVEVRGTVASGPYSWDAYNFPALYYDLKDDLAPETLNVSSIGGRTIPVDGLVYETQKMLKGYQVYWNKGILVNGKWFYSTIGWQGRMYVALNDKAYKLTELLIEHGAATSEKKTLAVGESWEMGDGWNLTALVIDAKASPRQAWLQLSKNGIVLDNKTVAQDEAYVYSANLSGEFNVPLFVTYVDTIFAGATSDMAQFRYTWLISDNVTVITAGDKFGNLTVQDASDLKLALKNDADIVLPKDSIVKIMGAMNFRTADNDTLRYYPFVEYKEPGTYEVRGSVANYYPGWNGTSWDAYNFSGFFYDLNYDAKTETLNVSSIGGRTIPVDGLVYETHTIPRDYQVYINKGIMVNGHSLIIQL